MTEEKKVYTCPKCGTDDVSVLHWIDLNAHDATISVGSMGHDCACWDCGHAFDFSVVADAASPEDQKRIDRRAQLERDLERHLRDREAMSRLGIDDVGHIDRVVAILEARLGR